MILEAPIPGRIGTEFWRKRLQWRREEAKVLASLADLVRPARCVADRRAILAGPAANSVAIVHEGPGASGLASVIVGISWVA